MKGKVIRSVGKGFLLAATVLPGLFGGRADAQSFNLGVAAGPQYTNLVSTVGEYKGKVGFHAGLSSETRIHKNFSVGLDFGYSTVGATRDYKDSLDIYDRWVVRRYNTEENYRYLNTQLLLKFNLPLGHSPIIPYDRPDSKNDIYLSLYAGGYFSHLAFWNWDSYQNSGTYEYYERTHQGEESETLQYNAEMDSRQKPYYVNPNSFGMVAGIGMSFKLNVRTTLAVDLQYKRGFNTLDYGDTSRPQYGSFIFQPDPINPLNSKQAYVAANTNPQIFALSIALRYRLFGKEPE